MKAITEQNRNAISLGIYIALRILKPKMLRELLAKGVLIPFHFLPSVKI